MATKVPVLIPTKITVTQEDIDQNGHSCMGCPHWRAIKRVVRRDVSVSVGGTSILFHNLSDGNFHQEETPRKAEDWIMHYDSYPYTNTQPQPQPIEYELLIPEWALKEVES